MGKGTCMHDGLKNSQNYFQNLGKKVISKKNRTKIFEKSLFSAIFGQKFDKSSDPIKLKRYKDACNSAKHPQYNLFEMEEIFLKISSQKTQKIDFWAQKWQKMAQK